MKHIVEGFKPLGGKHCITTALRQVFAYDGCSLSEAMIFGLGSGLAFTYINMASSPLVSGRSKPFEFEDKLARRLNVFIRCRRHRSDDTARSGVIRLLDENRPVVVYADMPYLSYLGLDSGSHFGGHAVVIAGYDQDQQVFYVSDRDSAEAPIRTPAGMIGADLHQVGFDEMARARGSSFRPFPANNKYLEIDVSRFEAVSEEAIVAAIRDTCESMLNPPAQLLGINGIAKFAREIRSWRKFEPDRRRRAGITNYFQISGDGGTGGGIFRKMYGEFLVEAGAMLDSGAISGVGSAFQELAQQWDLLAQQLWQLGQNGDAGMLDEMSRIIERLCEREKSLLGDLQLLI